MLICLAQDSYCASLLSLSGGSKLELEALLRRVLTVFKKNPLEATCRTKLVAPLNSDVHDRTVAHLEALEQAVWKS